MLRASSTRFWLKMGPKPTRKMALHQKVHKTGGSHIVFYSLGTFWDVKKLVTIAAPPGDFFIAQKCDIFNAIFKHIYTLIHNKITKKAKKANFNYFLIRLIMCFAL